MGKALFIVVEGMDGSGKSTQTRLLCEHLARKGREVVQTFEPTRGPIGSLLREKYLKEVDLPLADRFLFCADREEHLKRVVLPALEQGKDVVSDRYYHSSLAYGETQGLDLLWLIEMNKFFPRPDLMIFIDVLPETCMERIEKDSGEKRKIDKRMKFERIEFLRKLRESYLNLVKVLKNERIAVVDGNRSPEEVHAAVVKEVEKLL